MDSLFCIPHCLLIGDNLENIWYTTILAFGREYAFSLAGVECCQPVSPGAFTILQQFIHFRYKSKYSTSALLSKANTICQILHLLSSTLALQ